MNNYKYPVRLTGRVSLTPSGNYAWTSKDGNTRRMKDMAIEHLFYAIRMLFNHSVPPAFRVLGTGEHFNRCDDLFRRDGNEKSYSFNALADELDERDLDELSAEQRGQLTDIEANRRFLVTFLEG